MNGRPHEKPKAKGGTPELNIAEQVFTSQKISFRKMVMGPSFGKRILKVPLASGRGAGASPGASSMNWQPTRINAL